MTPFAGRQQQRAVGGLEHVGDGPDRELLENRPRRPAIGRAAQTAIRRDGEERPIGLEVAREGRGRERCNGRAAPGVAAVGREEKRAVRLKRQQRPVEGEAGRQEDANDVVSRGVVARLRQSSVQSFPGRAAVAAAEEAGLGRGICGRVCIEAGRDRQIHDGELAPGRRGENRLPGGAAIGGPHDAVAARPAHPTGLPPAGERQAIICEVGREREGSRHAAVGSCRTPVAIACRLRLRCGHAARLIQRGGGGEWAGKSERAERQDDEQSCHHSPDRRLASHCIPCTRQ